MSTPRPTRKKFDAAKRQNNATRKPLADDWLVRGPVQVRALDLEVVRTLVLRRLTWDGPPHARLKKLDLLRQRLDGTKHNESNIEQSFNERCFSELFDYSTLLSDGGDSFNVLAKLHVGSVRPNPKRKSAPRFNDFGIGLFDGRRSSLIASVELKGPGKDLDAPQSEPGYCGLSPVEQALETAKLSSECQWAIITNYSELRLYTVRNGELLVQAFLDQVRNAESLAFLRACFDRRALCEPHCADSGQFGEICMALPNTDHPSHPIAAQKGKHRMVVRCGPGADVPFAFHKIEAGMRKVFASSKELGRFSSPAVDSFGGFQIRMTDGWLWFEGESQVNKVNIRVAVSRYLELVVSCSMPGTDIVTHVSTTPQTMHPALLRLFGELLPGVHSSTDRGLNRSGDDQLLVESSLLDVSHVTWLHNKTGKADADVIRTDSLRLSGAGAVAGALQHMLSELAIYFRHDEGGISMDDSELAKLLSA